MKKILLILSTLTMSAALFAQGTQRPANSILARVGDVTVEKQSTYTPSFDIDGKNRKVKNVILLIGDGMGLGAIASAMYANGGELTMTNLHTMGYVRTQSADNFTTDSAASGTAYAAGIKTKNGYVGVDPDKQNVANIPEKISEKGYACGVLSTDDLNGATPAAFFAHQSDRNASATIWNDLPNSCLVFASAGTMTAFERLDLKVQESIKKEFTLVGSMNEAGAADSKRLLYLPGSVQYKDRGNYLPETTEEAIRYLSARGKNGFFLMVEGARIDKEAHSNKYTEMVKEALDFDKAVEAAVRFAEKDGHTLVIISADHETGAVALRRGEPETGYMQGSFTSTGHTPIMVPLFAYGPRSHEFAGSQENSDVSNKIVNILIGKQ